MTKKKTDTIEKKRKNFRLPSDLAKWADQYAQAKNTNLTQLIVDHLTKLRAREQKKQ